MYDLKTAFFINSLKSTFFKQAYEKVEVNIITGILISYLEASMLNKWQGTRRE